MLIKCFKHHSDSATKEQLWTLIYNKGWVSDHITYMLFYIPESLVDFALVIDPSLEPMRHLDWLA